MKCIVLHGRSAAEAWDIGMLRKAELVEKLDMTNCVSNSADLKEVADNCRGLSRPVHIAVPERRFRRDSKHWKAHLLARAVPRNSFYCISESVYSEAPYLFFALTGGLLSFPETCLLGMELCGRYSTNPVHAAAGRTEPGKDYLERPAPTTAVLLDRYVAALGLGRKSKVRRACSVLANGSRSPRESILHLMMRIVRRQGGYGLKGYLLNHRVLLPPELAALMGEESLQLDFYWEAFHLAVEYDGSNFHSSDRQRSYDNLRRLVLRQLGIQVITIDKYQMADMAVLDGIMQMVSQAVGGPEVLQDTDSRRRRAALHAQLLANDIQLY